MLCLLILLLPCVAFGDERILSFHSDIRVSSDSSIEVTETIVVRAEGREIRRGIFRDYPTTYQDRFGNAVEVSYQPLALLRNGSREDFHFERYGNGIRTWFGSADRLIQPGDHTYTFRYAAERMLGFFESHDELYWNVVPPGSSFPIDAASANVAFDFDVSGDDVDLHAYTGGMGSHGDDFEAAVLADSSVSFEARSTIRPGDSFTIAVGWPKGLIQEPDTAQKLAWLIADNRSVLVALVGLLLMLVYYILSWLHFGKDPVPGVRFARYEPPPGFSPASLRYIRHMRYDNTVTTAAVLNLAVKGYLRIERAGDEHLLHKAEPVVATPMAAGEQALYTALFAEKDEILLTNKESGTVGAARSAHKLALRRDYAKRYFRRNGWVNLPGILLGATSVIIALSVAPGPVPLAFVIMVLMVVVAGLFIRLLARPTFAGRKLLDELDGFTEYLEIAEKDELNLRNPPEKTPELFEKYLPFALAVGVEQVWAEKFSATLAAVSGSQTSYSPAWYGGSWNSNNLSHSMSSFGSNLGKSISSAATPPGSSSGSSGGYSGGGGGGGGVGGW